MQNDSLRSDLDLFHHMKVKDAPKIIKAASASIPPHLNVLTCAEGFGVSRMFGNSFKHILHWLGHTGKMFTKLSSTSS